MPKRNTKRKRPADNAPSADPAPESPKRPAAAAAAAAAPEDTSSLSHAPAQAAAGAGAGAAAAGSEPKSDTSVSEPDHVRHDAADGTELKLLIDEDGGPGLFSLSLKITDRVSDLKRAIGARFSIPVGSLYLYCDGHEIDALSGSDNQLSDFPQLASYPVVQAIRSAGKANFPPTFRIGDMLRVRDTTNVICDAVILTRRVVAGREYVYIRYTKFNPRWNEWIRTGDDRIQKTNDAEADGAVARPAAAAAPAASPVPESGASDTRTVVPLASLAGTWECGDGVTRELEDTGNIIQPALWLNTEYKLITTLVKPQMVDIQVINQFNPKLGWYGSIDLTKCRSSYKDLFRALKGGHGFRVVRMSNGGASLEFIAGFQPVPLLSMCTDCALRAHLNFGNRPARGFKDAKKDVARDEAKFKARKAQAGAAGPHDGNAAPPLKRMRFAEMLAATGVDGGGDDDTEASAERGAHKERRPSDKLPDLLKLLLVSRLLAVDRT
jgi:hypothetical protein